MPQDKVFGTGVICHTSAFPWMSELSPTKHIQITADRHGLLKFLTVKLHTKWNFLKKLNEVKKDFKTKSQVFSSI